MDKLLPSRHSGESRNPVPSSDIRYYIQINELDPGLRRGDEHGNKAQASGFIRRCCKLEGYGNALVPGFDEQRYMPEHAAGNAHRKHRVAGKIPVTARIERLPVIPHVHGDAGKVDFNLARLDTGELDIDQQWHDDGDRMRRDAQFDSPATGNVGMAGLFVQVASGHRFDGQIGLGQEQWRVLVAEHGDNGQGQDDRQVDKGKRTAHDKEFLGFFPDLERVETEQTSRSAQEPLIKCQNVIPAKAGIQKIQGTGHRLPPV